MVLGTVSPLIELGHRVGTFSPVTSIHVRSILVLALSVKNFSRDCLQLEVTVKLS